MRPRKQTILIMLVGLLLVAFAAVIAQTPAPGDQKKPAAESCCAMESCCCSDGSCPMKKEGETTSAAAADAKEGCCCSGDSCEMKDKADMKNHSCCAESCDMTKHDAKMKHDATMKHDTKGHKGDC